jgi:hypothetical protein
MRDAAPGGHEVQLAGTDHLFAAHAVAVEDLAFDEPCHRLQADVRVRRHPHPSTSRDLERTEMVHEAPRADGRPLALGEESAYGCAFSEIDLARFQQLADRLVRRPLALFRSGDRGSPFQVAHKPRVYGRAGPVAAAGDGLCRLSP